MSTEYAVVDSAFHGGGILYKTSSPREAYRWRQRNGDSCFNGSGCEGFAFLESEEGHWKRCEITKNQDVCCWTEGGKEDHEYADGTYTVHKIDHELKPARDVQSAKAPAL